MIRLARLVLLVSDRTVLAREKADEVRLRRSKMPERLLRSAVGVRGKFGHRSRDAPFYRLEPAGFGELLGDLAHFNIHPAHADPCDRAHSQWAQDQADHHDHELGFDTHKRPRHLSAAARSIPPAGSRTPPAIFAVPDSVTPPRIVPNVRA